MYNSIILILMVIIIFLLCYTSSLTHVKESMYIDNSLNIPCTIGCHNLGSNNCSKLDKSSSKICLNPFGQNGTIRTQDLASEDPASSISANSTSPIQSVRPIPNYGISPSTFKDVKNIVHIIDEKTGKDLKKDEQIYNYISILKQHGINNPYDSKYYNTRDKNLQLSITDLQQWVSYINKSDSKPEWLNYYESLNPSEKKELKYYTDILENNNINFYQKELFKDQKNTELTLVQAREWVEYLYGGSKPDFLI